MATLVNHQNSADKELIASPMGLIDAEDFKNQRTPIDALFPENGDDDSDEEYIEEEDLNDEPVDDDGDPTGEHDHHQDDNYALGGHVTRSGS